MSMSLALTGWIIEASAAIWAGKGIHALVVNRRAPATRGRRGLAEPWQWLTIALLDMIGGISRLMSAPG
jgi:hypothetical protein